MRMNIVAVSMRVIVEFSALIFRACASQRTVRDAKIKCAEQGQHQCHTKFETETKALGNDEPKKNDCAADNQKGDAVTDAPKNSGDGRVPDVALPADDCRHCDDVIGIGRVTHPEKKTENKDRQKGRHNLCAAFASINLTDLIAHSCP